MLDFTTFDYSYLWNDNFRKIVVVYRDDPPANSGSLHKKICQMLRKRYESERMRYQRELENFDEIMNEKLQIESCGDKTEQIDEILLYRDMPMNNFWAYIMNSGYVVPFIDNATLEPGSGDIYGTSLGYDETSEKLISIRRLFSEIGFGL